MPDNNSLNAPIPFDITKGGTGATNAADARDNLGITTGAKTFIGTPDEIIFINGDGSLPGDVQAGLALDVVVPGNEALTPPRGSTAARHATPLAGMIRGNTDTGRLEYYSYGEWRPVIFPINHITGFTNIVLSEFIMQFDAGQCVDSTNTFPIYNPFTFAKDITANWVEGSGFGGFPSALTLTANLPYYTFVIAKVDGTVDFGWDTSVVATNLLSDAAADGYVYYRRIGSCRTQVGSTDLETIFHQGDYFFYESPRQDFTIVYTGAGVIDNTIPLSVPPGVDVVVNINAVTERTATGAGDSKVYALPLSSPGVANNYLTHCVIGTADIALGSSIYQIPSSNGSIRLHQDITGAAGFAGNSYVSTNGWIDRRGE